MSDLEMFDGDMVNHVAKEEDPAADFLAREQNQLAGLEDDSLGLNDADVPPPHLAEEDEPITNNIEHVNGPGEINWPSTNSTSSRSVPREEPAQIKMWREEQRKMLEVKDSEEEVKKKELQESAKKEMDDWYARYKEQIEKSKLNNRNAEKEWVAERDAESPGLEWERIARLCDFNPKSSRSTKDTSRMRSIILQLKQSPVTPVKS